MLTIAQTYYVEPATATKTAHSLRLGRVEKQKSIIEEPYGNNDGIGLARMTQILMQVHFAMNDVPERHVLVR